MIDPRVLKHFGTSNAQLRAFFTATGSGKNADGTAREASPHWEKKAKLIKWASGLVEDGRKQCFRNYRQFAAVDLMNDSQPNLPENIPLMAYAQGKINVETAAVELKTLNCAEEFVERKNIAGPNQPEEVKTTINLPRLYEVCVNVGRSLLSRRADAQNNKYNSLRPFFKYDTRGTSLVDHLRGDVMSQYAEVMVDAFDHRHQHRQCVRSMFNYRTFLFPAGAWEYETQTHVAPEKFNGETVDAEIGDEGAKEKVKLRTQIVREGVRMTRPSTARVIYDTSHPPATFNSDTGCRWAGFFDVNRYGDIRQNNDFFNTEAITWNNAGVSVIDQNRAYFDLVFAGQPIAFPKPQQKQGEVDLAANNERTANAFLYSIDTDDEKAVFVTDLRLKVIPKQWGLGDYPHPVWLRLIMANEDTVIYAEWLPSLPCIYFGHNEDDTRLINISMAHEIMPWQDQLSNIFSQLLMKMKHSLLRFIIVNTDVTGKALADELEKKLNSPQYYINPHLLKVSLKEHAELGLDLEKVITVLGAGQGTNANESEYINNAFKAIVQILAIMERLLNFSPAEQGQPMPREATAEEIAAIESTTQSTYNAISASIDEARAAWKRIIYESSMAHASNEVYCPVSQRFSKETIRLAGFDVEEDPAAENNDSAAKNGHTVIGTKTKLIHNYVFTSRDGGDRSSNRESANVLVSLLGQVLPLIGPEAFGKKRIFEIVNEIFRLLSSYDLKLEMAEDEADGVMAPKVTEQFQQLVQALQEHEKEIQGLGEAIVKLQSIIQQLAPPAPAAA
jgi:hypothetical protein